METILLQKNFGTAVLKASGVLRGGGVIVYPTDTLYGLGADAVSDEAVAKVRAIKKRSRAKPIHAIFADINMVAEYAEVNDAAKKLAERFLPGPLTLVLKKKPGLNTGIAKGGDSIGIRIPDNEFCIELAKSFGGPYTATSANISGLSPQFSVEKTLEQLGKNANGVSLVVDGGELPMSKPTTVVNVVSGSLVVLREGAIPSSEILQVL